MLSPLDRKVWAKQISGLTSMNPDFQKKFQDNIKPNIKFTIIIIKTEIAVSPQHLLQSYQNFTWWMKWNVISITWLSSFSIHFVQ